MGASAGCELGFRLDLLKKKEIERKNKKCTEY
jgi:hypothetical protein